MASAWRTQATPCSSNSFPSGKVNDHRPETSIRSRTAPEQVARHVEVILELIRRREERNAVLKMARKATGAPAVITEEVATASESSSVDERTESAVEGDGHV